MITSFEKTLVEGVSPADPRNSPRYINKFCSTCKTNLMRWDKFINVQTNEVFAEDEIWYDEWICPQCQDGLYMDWPKFHYSEKSG